MYTASDFLNSPFVINNVTGGKTTSILVNDTIPNQSTTQIFITDDAGIEAVIDSVDSSCIYIPPNASVGHYIVKYKLVDSSGSVESNVSEVYIDIVSRTNSISQTFPNNSLDIVIAGETTDTSGGRVYVSPEVNTSNPTIYRSMILNGYSGTKEAEIMKLAQTSKPLFDRLADKVVDSISNDTPPQRQDVVKQTVEGVEFKFVI